MPYMPQHQALFGKDDRRKRLKPHRMRGAKRAIAVQKYGDPPHVESLCNTTRHRFEQRAHLHHRSDPGREICQNLIRLVSLPKEQMVDPAAQPFRERAQSEQQRKANRHQCHPHGDVHPRADRGSQHDDCRADHNLYNPDSARRQKILQPLAQNDPHIHRTIHDNHIGHRQREDQQRRDRKQGRPSVQVSVVNRHPR